MKKKDLEILLDVEKEKRGEFALVLQELVAEGQVEITKRGKYQIPENRAKFVKLKDHKSKKSSKIVTESLYFNSPSTTSYKVNSMLLSFTLDIKNSTEPSLSKS